MPSYLSLDQMASVVATATRLKVCETKIALLLFASTCVFYVWNCPFHFYKDEREGNPLIGPQILHL